jgi:hypothetical protein
MNIARIYPWICAFSFGALAPTLLAVCFLGIALFPLVFGITLGHALILGLPIALLFRAMHWTRLVAALAASFLIGATPIGILAWPVDFSTGTGASVDGIPTVIDGIPTATGWLHYCGILGVFGGFGAVGGLVFWLTLKYFGVLKTTDPSNPSIAS